MKILGATTVSGFIPPSMGFHENPIAWPKLDIEKLPSSIREILSLVPNSFIQKDGYLALSDKVRGEVGNVPLAPTNWNIKNNKSWDNLYSDTPWGIVLHWFGDKFSQQQDIDFYMRGFNGIRQFDDLYISTSAHFLVGDQEPVINGDSIGIIQTQKPATDGIPYQAAHIRGLDHDAHLEGKQYFIAALNKLSKQNPGTRSILQDFYDQPGVYAHMQTIGIEICGYDFDNPENYPKPQKIANVLSVVWALMKRYSIPANNIMGHFELQMSKSDPGKKFLALIKYLIGIKALIEVDNDMKHLVFGGFLKSPDLAKGAVLSYFKYIRDYLVLTATPRQINQWDAWSKCLIVYEIIKEGRAIQSRAETYYSPLTNRFWQTGFRYLMPDNHEGIDIYPDIQYAATNNQMQEIRLLSSGICIYLGRCNGLHDGLLAIFRHRLEDGSEIISSYGHLDEIAGIKIGSSYPGGSIIAKIGTPQTPPHGYLHFSLAYGPSWELYLNRNGSIPLNVGPTWIRNYFIDPAHFLYGKTPTPGGGDEDTPSSSRHTYL